MAPAPEGPRPLRRRLGGCLRSSRNAAQVGGRLRPDRRGPGRRPLSRRQARRAREGADRFPGGHPERIGQVNGGSPTLSEEGRRDLLGLARATIEARFRGEPPPRLASDRAETFGEPRAVFVTLRIGERLRGCIGTLAPEGDLSRAVPRFAIRAAFEDPRFPALSEPELPECTIEISVLTPPRAIGSPEEIQIGRDGLILEFGGRRSLLLPQVATEWGFDRTTFLAELSRKAGLPPEAWRQAEARLWSFQAEVFSEEERRPV
ncbi:MAG: TIGR00296 family protein [Acidobacteria bacterium]|nr:MAG: TIGR00296 family protein [Acidobacteriota bacterium]